MSRGTTTSTALPHYHTTTLPHGHNMEGAELYRMQEYLRWQTVRGGEGWSRGAEGCEAELVDDGVHPLLEERDVRYSRRVMRRAFATWAKLDNNHPFKFVANYYHELEKMFDSSPPHMQKFINDSLEVPASEESQQLFSEDFTNPFAEHPQRSTPSPKKQPENLYEIYCKNLSYKLYGPVEKSDKESNAEDARSQPGSSRCETQVSVESTPSKMSDDSCYHSVASPVTDHEE